MTRKKVQLAYIACDSARKSTFKKRKKGLLKKIDELTTLCGVEACAVLYSPYDPEPVVWPEREQARKVVEEFRQLPEMDQHRKMYDHPTYLKQRVTKATQQLARLQRDNREKEVALAMYGCIGGRRTLDGLNLMDLNDLGWMIERTLKEISVRLENLRRDNNENENDNPENGALVVVQQQEAPPQDPAFFMGPPPPPLPLGFFGMQGEEVVPGLGQYLGLGFGNAIDMQMGPPMWPMGQYYQMGPGGFAGAGASGSGSGSGGDGGVPDAMPTHFYP